jgi:hypothetical protein
VREDSSGVEEVIEEGVVAGVGEGELRMGGGV